MTFEIKFQQKFFKVVYLFSLILIRLEPDIINHIFYFDLFWDLIKYFFKEHFYKNDGIINLK